MPIPPKLRVLGEGKSSTVVYQKFGRAEKPLNSSDLEIMKVDVTAAYLNTPMNDNVTHKWLMLDKDVATGGT